MSGQVEEIVKRGRWFYDDAVPAEVTIMRRNFPYPPHPGDEDLPEGEDVPPPYGPDGFFYFAVYELTGVEGRRSGSGTDWYGSLDEVVRCVEATLKGRITWLDDDNTG